VMLTGRWQMQILAGVSTDAGTVTVGGVQQTAESDEYKRLLDLLENGLRSTPAKSVGQ